MEKIVDYSVVIDGIDKAIAGLKAMNAELDAGQQSGKAHANRMNALNDRINDIAKSFGAAEGKAKSFLTGFAEISSSTMEAELGFREFEATVKRSMSQGASETKALETGIKKLNKVQEQAAQAAKEEAAALAQVAAAQEKVNKASGKRKAEPINTNLERARAAIAEMNNFNRRDENDSVSIKSAAVDANIKDLKGLELALNEVAASNDAAFGETAQQKFAEYEAKAQRIIDKTKAAISETNKFRQQDQSDSGALRVIDVDKQVKDLKKLNSDLDDIMDDYFKKQDSRREKEHKDSVALNDAELNNRVNNINKIEKATLQGIRNTTKETLQQNQKIYDEKLTQAKKFLDFEAKVKSGAITKDQIKTQGAGSFVDIAVGEDITRNATGQLAGDIDRYRASLDQAALAQKRLGAAAKDTDKHTKEFTLSWQTMGRILVAQLFNEAFFGLQNAIRTSIKDAEELYKAVAEIQTIVQRTSATANNFSSAMASVLQVSSQINFTPQDTSTAFYETLSNQIGDNVNQIRDFITEAGHLGKVTRATLADSSDAISAVINSYNLSIGDANEVSSKLFTLVDQGRLKLEEVANHMGNVSVPASQLGVDFNNVAAALSAISIAGIPPRESMTLLRNVMFKLIDPTEAMTELFAEWGVASADAAIATFGFDGVIEKLGQEALKGNERIAELMGTIRGTRGVLGLTSENYRKFTKALEAAETSQREYNKIVEEYLANPGENFSKLIQQTSNQILELGLSIVSTTSALAEFFGETEEGNYVLAELVGTVAKFVIGAGAAVVAFASIATAGSALKALIAFSIANPAIGALAAFAAAIVTAFGVVATALETAEQRFGRISTAAIKANKDVTKAYEEGISKSFEDLEKIAQSAQEPLKKSSNILADLNKQLKSIGAEDALEDLAAGLERMSKALSGNSVDQKIALIFNSGAENSRAFGDGVRYTVESLEGFIDVNSRSADQAQNVIDKLKAQREAVLGLAAANRASLAQSITERNISTLAPGDRGPAQLQAAQAAANQAANVADPEESKRLFDIARKFLRDAEQSAFQTGAFGNIQKHAQFFNQQEAALFALQERRLGQELQAINVRGHELEVQQNQLLATNQQIQAEIDRRDVLKEQYDLQLAFLEEYKRRATQINTNPDFSTEERLKEKQRLDAQTRAGLNVITADSDTKAAFDKASKSVSLESQIADISVGQASVTLQQAELRDAANEQKKEREALAATTKEAGAELLTTAELLSKLTSDLRNVEKMRSNRFGGDLTPLASNPDPTVVALIEELKEAMKASESSTDPNIFKIELTRLYTEFATFVSDNKVTDKNVIEALGAVTKIFQGFESQEGLIGEVDKFLATQLEEFTAATTKLEETISRVGGNLEALLPNDVQAKSASSEEEEDPFIFSDFTELIKYLDPQFKNLFAILNNRPAQQGSTNVHVVQPTSPLLDEQWKIQQQQQQVIDLERQNAQKQQSLFGGGAPLRPDARGGLIYGQAAENFLGPRTTGPMINGRPAHEVLGDRPPNSYGDQSQGPMINGLPVWLYRFNQEAPNTMSKGVEQGAHSVQQAVEQGSYSINAAVVDGVTRAFQQNQVNPYAPPVNRNPYGYGEPARRFANGGPVGTDTIPAWLSSGEYVVNAAASARNFNWLQAINSGVTPRYYDSGGSVSNSQVFTNNFNVTSNNPNAQVGAIISAMRRQISQGKATLSKRRPY